LRRVPVSLRVATALTAVCATVTSGALVLVAQPAVAHGGGGSAGTVKAQIGSAKHQLSALDAKVEAASERYDAARNRLGAAQQTAATAAQRLGQSKSKVASLQSRVTAFAVAAYRGDTVSPLLTLANTGSAALMVRQMSSMQAVSESQAAALADVAAARRTEEQAQATATAALAAQQAAVKAMQADRAQILAAAHQEQQLLGRLQVREQAIIKAAKARRARLAAERRAAALAARQAAEAAAARALSAAPSTPAPPAAPPAPVAGSGGAKVAVQWAYKELGKPYVWAAAGPDTFDCSGLTQYVWGKAGVALEHFTGDQWVEGTHVTQSQLEPGDLVFFAYNIHDPSSIHHVGIYVGGGNMIDAPFTGADVRVEPYDRSDYIGAVRPG
jgi:cell wall-associated NlpC family hydrolase